MKIFRRTKNLKNILEGLKSNVGIFRGTIYLFNPKTNVEVINMSEICVSFTYLPL